MRDGDAELAVRVTPRAGRTEAVGAAGGVLRIRIAVPPVDGAANDELLRYLAKTLGVTRSRLSIVAGTTSRGKRVRVTGWTCADLAAAP
ncbi:MAG: DUF167 domain-containing protein [Chloroflexia bacterium]|nr:DUF167 domain-containing protein [Chloroflexia bacterium]